LWFCTDGATHKDIGFGASQKEREREVGLNQFSIGRKFKVGKDAVPSA